MPLWIQIAAPLLLCAYYALVLLKLGRQEQTGSVTPRYEPPDGLSPAAVRYVWKNAVDARTVAAVFAQLATKHLIAIEPDAQTLRIKRLSKEADALAPEESTAMDWLFAGIDKEMRFDPATDSEGCVLAMRGALDRYLRNRYSIGNIQYAIYGTLLACAITCASLAATGSGNGALYLLSLAMLVLAPIFGEALRTTLISAIQDALRGFGSSGRLILGALVSLPIVAGFVEATAELARLLSLRFALTIAQSAVLNFVAVPLLRRTTRDGMEVRRQIAGYREFLIAAEQDSLDRLNIPRAALDHAAPGLPYAIALEVKERWGDTLANTIYSRLVT